MFYVSLLGLKHIFRFVPVSRVCDLRRVSETCLFQAKDSWAVLMIIGNLGFSYAFFVFVKVGF